MKEMTLQELKDFSLKILCDVHDFCDRNEIVYSLAGGSLIGAVRHHGFIPWDDDVDIVMPRPDYERFMKTYKSNNGYVAISRASGDKTTQIAFGRVCDMKDTLVKTKLPWCSRKTGVWIDVFPLDGASDDKDAVEKKVNEIIPLLKRSFKQRSARRNPFECRGFWGFIKNIVRFSYLLMGDMIGQVDKMAKQIPYGSTDHYFSYSFLRYGMKEYHRLACFEKTIPASFEGHDLKMMIGYDEVLREQYGDYMQLPPVEQQKPKQTSYMRCFWK
ncbi:MAG: lipopolysaccharide cholinephosphotransferase [bacterium F082]|nr:MAG: lipopolysaccharide cholinephosphotransferase [bacterium F082]KWW31135.1 MAG: lipopolysaccharide cholinephosphotransferase [bacterium P201]